MVCQLRHTFCTRLLSTVLPYPYTKENLRVVLQDMVTDMQTLFDEGIKEHWLSLYHRFSNLICFKGKIAVPPPMVPLSQPSLFAQVKWNEKEYQWKFVFLGCKGDWPFLRSAWGLQSGFASTRVCHRCDLHDSQPIELLLLICLF